LISTTSPPDGETAASSREEEKQWLHGFDQHNLSAQRRDHGEQQRRRKRLEELDQPNLFVRRRRRNQWLKEMDQRNLPRRRRGREVRAEKKETSREEGKQKNPMVERI